MSELGSDRPCEALFERLAEQDPARLCRLLSSGELPSHFLTFAAEIAGRIEGTMPVEPLVALLSHESAFVREGALYGLASHLTPALVARLRSMAKDDPSPAVRGIAAEIAEET